MIDDHINDAQERIIQNAITFANAVWNDLTHAVKHLAHIEFAQSLTALERQGWSTDLNGYAACTTLADYLDERYFPADALEFQLGDEFTENAARHMLKLIRDYNVIPFPNSDEVTETPPDDGLETRDFIID